MSVLGQIKKRIPKTILKQIVKPYHFILSASAALAYKNPSNKLIVIGVTGTSGKTTTTCLIAQTLRQAGYKVGYTSTAMFSDGQTDWLNDKKMTMPGRFFIQDMLSRMVKNKCQYAIVETTSEGIVQFRHRFINYDVLVFTGLYPEHIESHGGFDNYKKAKGNLFKHLKNCQSKYTDDNKQVIQVESNFKKLNYSKVKKTIIVNGLDEHKEYFKDFWAEQKFEFGINELEPKNINLQASGIEFEIDSTKFKSSLLGKFNISNLLACISVGLSQNLELLKISEAVAGISGVPGRLETINLGQDFTIIVDYAFEPVAVTKLYETINLIEHNKIIHVLGSCGGGRDAARRPVLGELAAKNADYMIVTNEDPYDEDPEVIMDQVIAGAKEIGKNSNHIFKILDRRQAINKALSLAQAGDVVVITGKGCEQAICLANGEKMPWDDREVVKEEYIKKLDII